MPLRPPADMVCALSFPTCSKVGKLQSVWVKFIVKDILNSGKFQSRMISVVVVIDRKTNLFDRWMLSPFVCQNHVLLSWRNIACQLGTKGNEPKLLCQQINSEQEMSSARVDSHQSPFRCTVLCFFPENHNKGLNSLKIRTERKCNIIFSKPRLWVSSLSFWYFCWCLWDPLAVQGNGGKSTGP